MTLTSTIILNVVLDTLVVGAILGLLGWGIRADATDRARRRQLQRATDARGRWRPAEAERRAA